MLERCRDGLAPVGGFVEARWVRVLIVGMLKVRLGVLLRQELILVVGVAGSVGFASRRHRSN